MKNTILVPSTKRKNLLNAIILVVVLFAVFLVGGITLFKTASTFKYENLTNTQITINSVEIINNEVQIKSEQSTYTIKPIIAEQMNLDEINLLKDNQAKIYYLEQTNEIFGVESTVFNLDANKMIVIRHDACIIPAIVLTVVSVILLVVAIILIFIFKKSKKEVEKDILTNLYPNNFISPYRKKYLNGVFLLLILPLIFLILMIIENSKNNESTLFYIYLGLFLSILLLWMVITLALLPKIRTKDAIFSAFAYNLDKFYQSDAENLHYDILNDIIFAFTEQGLHYEFDKMLELEQLHFEYLAEKEHFEDNAKKLDYIEALKIEYKKMLENKYPNTLIDYNELNLRLKIACTPKGLASCFVMSNLDKNNKYNLTKDVLFELDPVSYHYIKLYNIKVEGLDKFMQNREQIFLENCKGKPKVIEIND